jgi:hypothetical protein
VTRRILPDESRHAISRLMFLYGDRANFNEFVPVVTVGPMPSMAVPIPRVVIMPI